MKKLKNLIPALFILMMSVSAFSLNPETKLIGKWKFETNQAPWEYQKGEIVFEQSDDGLTGRVLFDRAGNVRISRIDIDNESELITLTLYVEGALVKVIGTIDNDKISGHAEVDYNKMVFSAEKL